MLIENIKLCLTGLMANKIRTFLTMLGIIIGIAAMIAIMTVSDAMNKSVMSSMGSMGADKIEVFLTQKSYDDSTSREMKNSDYFNDRMFEELSNKFEGRITGIALSKSIGSSRVENGKLYANVDIRGLNPMALAGENLTILSGRSITEKDEEASAKVALVSDKYVQKIFQDDNASALGKEIEVLVDNKYYTYTIVGVYQYVDSGMTAGFSQEDISTIVYIPFSVAQMQVENGDLYDEFSVKASNGTDPASLSMEIQDYINTTFYQDNDAYESYSYSMKEQLKQMNAMLNTQKNAFMAIGAIALLVGGIGVMNIMIVSITERTREIGTRKALGATNNDIRIQFIIEAMMICLLGGMIGIIVGLSFGILATKVMGFQGSASVGGIVVCVLFSMAFGLFFGYYPANKAAKMNPIEALRYE
ncbi:ABC transporter permease [Oribacterium sp. WCC10]|uniref:ABC transporter permease n=1 Tax=Oribacterium sp. WCC10 TaxID=1855343 RepID=UPI0008F2D42B|nr:ABC transporter permease [Oribacterium sp. WCC10]SFG18536.1 putative ABC transport system permease protein [Oribacterium sp. WCC10]